MMAAVPAAGPALPTALQAHGGPGAPAHVELFGGAQDCAGPAFALALARDRATLGDERPWLWVQDRAALRLTGRPYRPGLPRALRHRLIHVATTTPEDALFALEEGLRCRDLAFVVGEIAGNPRALSLTAQRRLSLVAEKHGVPLWLVRVGAGRDLSSARQRWTLRPAASLPPRWNAQAPGTAAWHAELFRARNHPPGEWILRDDGDFLTAAQPHQSQNDSTHPVDLAGPAGDRPLAAG
jgi:protein ImuA